MNLRPTRTFMCYLCFIGFALLVHISCSKDNDVFLDAVLSKDDDSIIAEDNPVSEEVEEEPEGDSDISSEEMEDFESRITAFPPLNDAYVQNGQGYDNNLIRLQENFRRSYLMFDLSPIDSINGKLISANLRFIINTDDGNGTIKVYRAASNDWSESDLSEKTAPVIENQIGEIAQVYKLGDEVEIELNVSGWPLEMTTLILEHENGNDLAFASKENTIKPGPKLEVTYEAPISSEEILIADDQVIEGTEDEADETTGDETADETTDEEDTTGEETTDDETTEDETNTEEETTGDDSTEDNTNTEEEANAAPIALAEATPLTGTAPLTVDFTGSNSSDDKSVTSFEWNFKDGASSNNANPSHTFDTAGTYEVALTVRDAEGLEDSTVVTIIVVPPPVVNQAPVAVANADRLMGDAPLIINFTGNNSTDDVEVVSYLWDFQGGSSTDANPSYTFTSAGNYNVTLTVTDGEGLQSTSSLSITVNPEPPSDPVQNAIPCSAGGSLANVPGEKVWCWNNLASEINAAGPLASFSSGELAKSVHYDGQGVRVSNDRLHFKLNPSSPDLGNGNNYRSEIRENPSNVDHALGTEQWFGWDYKFSNDYQADAANEWIMWQVHGSFSSPAAPLISLWAARQNMASQTNAAGEIFVVNAAINTNNAKYVPTGIVPRAGQTLEIVVHVIWGDANTGLYEVWINGNKIYSEHERTVYVEQPEGGYAKWGIYKWKWRSNSNVAASQNQGITELNTSMGTLRSVMRRPGDPDYAKNAYSLVAPDGF